MRGVNKLVLEIRPDGDYFEKAILFINPDKINISQNKISENAEKLLSDISVSKNYRKLNRFDLILSVFIGIITGSAFTCLILLLSGIL